MVKVAVKVRRRIGRTHCPNLHDRLANRSTNQQYAGASSVLRREFVLPCTRASGSIPRAVEKLLELCCVHVNRAINNENLPRKKAVSDITKTEILPVEEIIITDTVADLMNISLLIRDSYYFYYYYYYYYYLLYSPLVDRLCGLVVRVLGYRSVGSG
jgi:hypothetical protein